MTLYTPHSPNALSETCEIVAVLPDGRVRVELLRVYASGAQRTGKFRVYPRHELRASGGIAELRAAVEAARANPHHNETPEEKLAREIRQTGRVPYDPASEEL